MVFRLRENDEILQREYGVDYYPANTRMIYMHNIFSNIYFLAKNKRNWNLDMQLHAYLRSLTNNSVQYK